MRDASHPLLIIKPCYLLALWMHKACIHNPNSLQQPGVASLWMSHTHLTTTLPTNMQDQTPTFKGTCVLIPPYPQSQSAVVHPAHQPSDVSGLSYPEMAHTMCFESLNESPAFLNCGFYSQISNFLPTIGPDAHIHDCRGTVLGGLFPLEFPLSPSAPCDTSPSEVKDSLSLTLCWHHSLLY